MRNLSSGLLNVEKPELDGIHPHRFRHFVHHAFPGELELLLRVAPGRTDQLRVRRVVVRYFSPVRDNVQVEFRTPSTASSAATATGTDRNVDFPLADRDAPVACGSNLKMGQAFRFHRHLSQFLVLGERNLHRSTCHLGDMGDEDLEPHRPGVGTKSAAVPFVDESNIGFIDAQSTS